MNVNMDFMERQKGGMCTSMLDKCLKANTRGKSLQSPVIMGPWPTEVCGALVVGLQDISAMHDISI